MLAFTLTRYAVCLLFLAISVVSHARKSDNPFNCKGGTIYFAAHPVDVLIYQNPSVFHDLYVYKCVTTVLFTSDDRGIQGNHSRSVERGLEDAFAFMTAQPEKNTSWTETGVQLDGKIVLLRSLKKLPRTHILYLRLPSSTPDGQAYGSSNGQSLKKLYNKEIRSISAIDGSATYTLSTLRDLISTILSHREANDIRILNLKASIPEDNEEDLDHADHSVSARLVAETVEKDDIKANMTSYACGVTRKLQKNLDQFNSDVKIDAYFQYASHDKHKCKDFEQCERLAEEGSEKSIPDNDDGQYIAKWLEREYIVQ